MHSFVPFVSNHSFKSTDRGRDTSLLRCSEDKVKRRKREAIIKDKTVAVKKRKMGASETKPRVIAQPVVRFDYGYVEQTSQAHRRITPVTSTRNEGRQHIVRQERTSHEAESHSRFNPTPGTNQMCNKESYAVSQETSQTHRRVTPIYSRRNEERQDIVRQERTSHEAESHSRIDPTPGTSQIRNEESYAVGQEVAWNEEELLAKQSSVSLSVVRAFVQLLNEGNTLPFIARYRKTAVGNLMPDDLVDLYDKYQNLLELKKKIKNKVETLKKANKLTYEIERSIVSVKSVSELDIVYAPHKTEKMTLAQQAKNLGLEEPAKRLLNLEVVDIVGLCDPRRAEMESPDKVEAHLVHIMAETICKDPRVIQHMIKLKDETNFVLVSSRTQSSMKEMDETKKKNLKSKNDPENYKIYFNFSRPTKMLESYQVLAIDRGEENKILNVKVKIPNFFMNELEKFCKTLWKSGVYLKKALDDGFARLIKPWLTRQVRSQLTSEAHKAANKRFAENLKVYLLTEPVKNKTIAGLDPGFRAGLKVGIIDSHGKMLHTSTIKLNFNRALDPAASELDQKLQCFQVDLIGLGNGTACRETESWLQRHGIAGRVPVVIVPEAGASVYSISKEALREHPNMDPNHISALSIARRVMDPLGELIKVDPKNLGVGMYQHDISNKTLDSTVAMTVENIVSLHGVDLNTASHALLKRVAGLKENQAANIIEYREKYGRFKTREEILKVPGVGKVTFQQCAGFLKVTGGPNPLDHTIIHPESYGVAEKIAKLLSINLNNIFERSFAELVNIKLGGISINDIVRMMNCDEGTVSVIFSAFKNVSHEQLTLQKPVYSQCVQEINQLQEGMILSGVVRNVVDFGCFVDVGVGRDGLVHKSKYNRHEPELNMRVSVKVLTHNNPNKINLELVEILP